MRGPLFQRLIERREYNLQSDESLADLEEMYTILIEARGKTINTLNQFDETIALAALCQISFPGKTPTYISEARQFRAKYKGISASYRLENEFKNKVRTSFTSALNESQISFRSLRDLFFD